MSELDLAGREGLILHDYGAAGSQNHDIQILLPLVGLLVPVPGHLCIMGRDQSHLVGAQGNKMRRSLVLSSDQNHADVMVITIDGSYFLTPQLSRNHGQD